MAFTQIAKINALAILGGSTIPAGMEMHRWNRYLQLWNDPDGTLDQIVNYTEYAPKFEISAPNYSQIAFNGYLRPNEWTNSLYQFPDIVFPVASTDWGQITHAVVTAQIPSRGAYEVAWIAKLDKPKIVFAGDQFIFRYGTMSSGITISFD